MDIERQIEHWRVSVQEDMAAAEDLLEKERSRHALFFAHLALEKMLKAHVTRTTADVPPKIHNLVRLAEIAGLQLSREQKEFLREFDIYQVAARYPGAVRMPIDSETARAEMTQAREMLEWLTMTS